MKKTIITLLILLIPFTIVNALTPKDVEIKDYVNDYANVLSPELEDTIIKKSRQLDEIDGTQIVVVTINTLEGEDLESFTNQLGNYYKIGGDSKGLIILLVTEDRDIRVEVGDNLEGILNDGKVGRYIDNYMIPYLKDNDWENGIKNGYNAFFNEIVEQNHLDLETEEVISTGDSSDIDSIILFTMFFPFFVSIIGGMNNTKRITIADIVCVACILSPTIISMIFYPAYISGCAVVSVIFLILFLLIRLSSKNGGRYSGGGSHWSSGGGGHSSGGFSGGGGHFSGGGASRHF